MHLTRGQRSLTAGSPPGRVHGARRIIDEGRTTGSRAETHEVVVYRHAATGSDAARMAAERGQWGYDHDSDVTVGGRASDVAEAVARLS